MSLHLRRLESSDESAFAQAYALGDDSSHIFALGRLKDQPFKDYLQSLRDTERGLNLNPKFVPATYLCGFVDGLIVGRVSLRHQLNDYLAKVGGHLGYVVLPPFRRRGYATEMLRQSLPVAEALGLSRVLLTCDDDNLASIKTIEACGGIFEGYCDTPKKSRRYWISLGPLRP